MASDPQDGEIHFFGAIPPRAICDPRLKGRHFRVLAAIGINDRMSIVNDGQGCWMSVKAMAARWNINYSNFSTALNELVEWRYVVREKRTADKRTMVLRIVYRMEDNALCYEPKGPESNLPQGQSNISSEPVPHQFPTERSFATATKDSGEIVCPFPKVVCPVPEKGQQDQRDVGYNISPRTNLTKRSSINSPKGALRADWVEGIVTNPERVFNEIYVCLKRGDSVTEEFMTALGMIASRENGKPLGSRASHELEYCRKMAA